jgi:hypothetical protein
MKKTLMAAVVASFMLFGAATSDAQVKKPVAKKKTTVTKSTTRSTVSSVGSEGNAPENGKSEAQMQAETSGDPLYMNHPYFNGEERWSHPDTLYKHGDFPWAMVNQHPENFRFNPQSGQWEMLNTPNMGNSNQSR